MSESIIPANAYAPARGRTRAGASSAPARGLTILVPKPAAFIRWDEYMWREMREGGRLHRYLQREKATSVQRQRAVGRRMHGFRQNHKSEHQLVAAVPARDFFRWKSEDKDFWRDDSNLRSLKRDNPDLCIYV